MPGGDLAAMVYRRLQRDDLGEFAMDSRMLTVLMDLDGQRSLGQIAGDLVDVEAPLTEGGSDEANIRFGIAEDDRALGVLVLEDAGEDRLLVGGESPAVGLQAEVLRGGAGAGIGARQREDHHLAPGHQVGQRHGVPIHRLEGEFGRGVPLEG